MQALEAVALELLDALEDRDNVSNTHDMCYKRSLIISN